MQTQPSSPEPKPVTDWWRPDLVSLPKLTLARRVFRVFGRGLAKLLTFYMLDAKVSGVENFPKHGPALVVINHLGDADAVLLAAAINTTIDGMGKIELYDHWLAGPVLRAYGVIWVHRGKPDRKALRAALDGLSQGRLVALAPEGRQSLENGLEEGTEGAAFLAMKSGALIVPVAMTGTENENVYNGKFWKRAKATLVVGKPFYLKEYADRQTMLREGTRQIMQSLADLLPEEYRGKYKVG
ncbi:MAG TPA: lysophospholipid acyltransferase family protein [Anaerolineales bacterium]|nr:lysophospholipid acyltransferase family protein [Anaerolineales bacterium]